MTQQEFMDIYAPEIAAQGMTQDPDAFCKEIQSLCGCSAAAALRTLMLTFDNALKIRDNH